MCALSCLFSVNINVRTNVKNVSKIAIVKGDGRNLVNDVSLLLERDIFKMEDHLLRFDYSQIPGFLIRQ